MNRFLTGDQQLTIIDARAYQAAAANFFGGGGYENKENYRSCCSIEFQNIDNIHGSFFCCFSLTF